MKKRERKADKTSTFRPSPPDTTLSIKFYSSTPFDYHKKC